MIPHGVLETCLCAADLDAAERFYTTVLGLTLIERQADRHVFFRCGRGVFLVFNPAVTAVPAAVAGQTIPPHGTTGAGHAAFAVRDGEIADWRRRLQAAGVAIESEIAWPQGGYSLYFRDPAGNLLELATPRIWGIDAEE